MRSGGSLLLVALLGLFVRDATAATIGPLVGRPETYTVRDGDSLYRIARRRLLAASAIARLNGLSGHRVHVGQRLRLPTEHILPLAPTEGIVLNIPERAVYVFRAGRLLARYPVAVGRPGWQTAIGEYRLRSKTVNPTWTPPRSMVEKEGVRDDPVPPGPDNPLGDRWMGWTAPGYGFHSTTAPRSIGTAASHGCVRLYPEAAHRMFQQVSVGMPIHALYEPVLVGERAGRFYLSVFPDVYGTGEARLERVRDRLARLGLLPLADQSAVARAVGRQEGYPTPIMGAREALEVSGQAVPMPIAPVLVAGRWAVAVRPVVDALGGQLRRTEQGAVEVVAGARTLVLTPGQGEANLDGGAVDLSPAPTVIGGVLVAPLRPIAELFGAAVSVEKGRAIVLTPAPTEGVEPPVPAAPPRAGEPASP